MNFLRYTTDLLISFLDPDFLAMWFYPLLGLAFIALVPRLIVSLFTWR